MLYYIALIWNPLDERKGQIAASMSRRLRDHAPDWRVAIDISGLSVFYRQIGKSGPDEAYFLSHGKGVVFGKLFPTLQENDVRSVPAATFDKTQWPDRADARARHLIMKYWGRYVAFLRDQESMTTCVLRDPSGGVPCQWSRISGIDVYFLRPEDCELLAPCNFNINSHYLLGYLLYDNAAVRETGLAEIESVLAGECIEHSGADVRRLFYWDPLQVARSDVIEDAADAIRSTRRVVQACVSSWASCFNGILHQLSGGLDSSIILACLALSQTNSRIACINEYSEGADSDERLFAREAARKAGVDLIERKRSATINLDGLRSVPPTVTPFPCIGDAEYMQQRARELRSEGFTAIFNGFGGDELFYRGGPLPTAVDFVWRRGLRPHTAAIALSDARYRQVSVWKVLRLAVRYGLLKRSWDIRRSVPSTYRPLIPQEIKRSAYSDWTLWHPLYRDAKDVPPCKLAHAYSLTCHTARCYTPEITEDAPVSVFPLSSQPLIELSLRIPTYLLTANGRDRSIARSAFTDAVPRRIVHRRTKGGVEDYAQSVIRQNIKLVRELLFEGYLVREGLLDREKLDDILGRRITHVATHAAELFDYLNVEAWIRTWTRRQRRIAA